MKFFWGWLGGLFFLKVGRGRKAAGISLKKCVHIVVEAAACAEGSSFSPLYCAREQVLTTLPYS